MPVPRRTEECIRSPETKLAQCRCWKPNLGSLQKQEGLLNAEQSLQTPFIHFQDRISLCIQGFLKLEILFPPPSHSGVTGVCHKHMALDFWQRYNGHPKKIAFSTKSPELSYTQKQKMTIEGLEMKLHWLSACLHSWAHFWVQSPAMNKLGMALHCCNSSTLGAGDRRIRIQVPLELHHKQKLTQCVQ